MAPGDQRRTRLSVLLSDARGRRLSASGLARWLVRVAPSAACGIVNVALVSDARIRDLNRRYRGKDYATDVLSFSCGASVPAATSLPSRSAAARRGAPVGHADAAAARPRPRASRGLSSAPPLMLGDIVIATGVARRQARHAGHSEVTELRVLALHGLLHLLGYDHEQDNGTMARLERRLRRKGRLREGLLERDGPRHGI
jgi:probable rRNA maturation factor